MTPNSTKLSLRLPPEVAKIMPWIVSAKASGDPKKVAWAKREYEVATERAQQRERCEREAAARREEQEYVQQLVSEQQEQEYNEWLEEQNKQLKRLEELGIRWALEDDGHEYVQPSQGSSGGGLHYQWSRTQEEGIRDHSFWERGILPWTGRSNQSYGRKNRYRGHTHNCGRKPRKPWFKKQRAQP